MGLGTILTDLSEKIRNALSSFAEFIRSHSRIAILVAAAFLLIILLLFALSILSHRQSKAIPERQPALEESSGGVVAEDFFLPYEPDFVPDILLEKEPRDVWTEEDARPFWTDPMEGNETVWRKRIESGVDSLLENVP